MENAILKTLIYSSIFDYPLKVYEIHKWLIGTNGTLRQLQKALNKQTKIKSEKGYYFLGRPNGQVLKRKRKEKQSEIYFKKAKRLSQILKLVPWIKLVGVSGGVAMNNAGKSDDIDFFIIAGKNRIWVSRLLTIGLLSLVRQRRKRADKGRKIAGKLCLNILLEEDKLEQKNKDIFVAHEVLQMKPLWQRDGIYSKYLEDNAWAMKFLPNWVGNITSKYNVSSIMYSGGSKKSHHTLYTILDTFVDFLENLAKWLQLRIMQEPQGMERIEQGALYFHPDDCRNKVLSEYKIKLKKFLANP